MTSRIAAAACLAFLAGDARAQFPSLRMTDTRTSTPEAVMGDRKLWGADVDFGGSFNRGNTNIDYLGGGFNLFRSWQPSTLYLSGTGVYDDFNGIRVINLGSITARYDYALTDAWRVFVFNTNAYNEFTRLNYRETTGAGPWYDFSAGPTRNGVSVAAVQEYENYQGHVFYRTGRASLRDVTRLPISDTAELRADVFYAPKADEPGNYQMYGEVDFETLVWKKYLALKLAWSDEYNSRPQPGIKPSDTLWLTTLKLRFGR